MASDVSVRARSTSRRTTRWPTTTCRHVPLAVRGAAGGGAAIARASSRALANDQMSVHHVNGPTEKRTMKVNELERILVRSVLRCRTMRRLAEKLRGVVKGA